MGFVPYTLNAMNTHDRYMLRAIQLAKMASNVSPNPKVGAILVCNGRIISEGYHARCGEKHAEIHAIDGVQDKSLLKKSTLYITLEPCSHFGKTPPCADKIIKENIAHVVIGSTDPNKEVYGRGVKKLLDAGIRVECGVQEEQCRAINPFFYHFHTQKRPYIILKWAMNQVGVMGLPNEQIWISNALSQQITHKWRSQVQAILVGKNTALVDKPSLNVRTWSGKNPIRIIIDPKCQISQISKTHPSLHTGNTWCYNTMKSEKQGNTTWIKLSQEMFLEGLISDLTKRNIQSLLVEGGSDTLRYFIESGFWDEARVFKSKHTTPQLGIYAPKLSNAKLKKQDQIDSDVLSYYVKANHL